MSSGGRSEVDFDEWYSVERPRLVSLLVRTGQSRADAQEIADEAMARALARWSRVGNMSSPAGWTTVVAFNLARRRASRSGRERALLATRSAPAPSSDPADTATPEVWSAVRALPDRQRTMIVLRYLHDLTEAQIARLMRVRRGTVASCLHDARRSLGSTLRARPGEADLPGPRGGAARELDAPTGISSTKEGT